MHRFSSETRREYFLTIVRLVHRCFVDKNHVLACLILLCSGHVIAQASKHSPYFGASIELEFAHSDNANFAENPDEALKENQWQVGLGLLGAIDQQHVQLALDYFGDRRQFEQKSQGEETRWQGDSALTLGSPLTLLGADFQHSISEERIVAGLPGSNDNTEQVQIRTGALDLNLLRGKMNTLTLRQAIEDAESEGGVNKDLVDISSSAILTRRLSSSSEASINLTHKDVDYRAGDNDDYTRQMASLLYQRSARLSTLALELGHARIDSTGQETLSGATYTIKMDLTSAYHTVSLALNQDYSDSGRINAGLPGENVAPNNQGLVKIKRATLAWATQAVCQHCEISVQGFISENAFVYSPDNDYMQGRLSLAFEYQLNRFLALKSTITEEEYDYERELSNQASYTEREATLTLTASSKPEQNIALFFEREELDSEFAQTYSENKYGLKYAYLF